MRARTLVWGLLGVVLLTCASAGAASGRVGGAASRAAATPVIPGFGPAVPEVIKVDKTDAQLRAYWTPERMASAQPMPLSVGLNQPIAKFRPRAIPEISGRKPLAPLAFPALQRHVGGPHFGGRLPAITTSTSYQGSQPLYPWYGRGYLAYDQYNPAVGRIYFSTPTGTSACTGTAVSADVVLTAAHCVVDTNYNYYSNWVFVPGQVASSAPYGLFTARTAIAWSYYASVRDPIVSSLGFGPMDYAFIVMNPNADTGQSLGATVGYFGLLYNSPGTSAIFHTGYPGSGGFSQYCPFSTSGGSDLTCFQWYCYSPIGGYANYYTDWWEVGMGCLTGHGSSGGPWFEQYNGNWYVASDESTCWSASNNCGNYSDNAWGPYFNQWTKWLFDYANTL